MSYEVLARKYRPQQFSDVVGQSHVTATLKNAISSERVAHAYLFVGPRGTGKTTSARILAKALNCQQGPTPEPCDACDACREIMAGNNLDVLEIDGASNTGVDHVRELRENTQFAPTGGKFKIYIIDEVHMLSTGAFNALLKTLEEPPAHVKFFFATTEPQKVPATILSRCQRFDLRRISTPAIVEKLKAIAGAEDVVIDDDAMMAIARGAEGGMRDALSTLDQLIAFCGKKISEADVLSVFGLVSRQLLDDTLEAILAGDVREAIRIIHELDESGKDLQRYNLELIESFRNVLVAQYGDEAIQSIDVLADQEEKIKAYASQSSPGRVLRIVDILTDVENRMRYALSKRTLLETAIIKACRAASVVTLDEILQQINQLKGLAGAKMPVQDTPEERELIPKDAPKAKPVARADAVREARGPSGSDAGTSDIEILSSKWHEMIDAVGHVVALAKSYLLDAKPVAVQGDQVMLGFDPEFAENRDKMDVPRNAKAVKKAVSRILGRDVEVSFTVLDAASTLPGDIKLDKTDSSGQPRSEVNTEVSKVKAKTKNEWLHNPAVRKTLEAFNGDIADVRE